MSKAKGEGHGERQTTSRSASSYSHSSASHSYFKFVPKELAAKCRQLLESYHAMHGYTSLPDMIWQCDARDIVECHRELARDFRSASRSRGARRANDSFLSIATSILAVEVLARDFAGWGKRFPVAKREAETILVDSPTRRRLWFMDQYLYPSLSMQREMAGDLTPPNGAEVLPPTSTG